MACYYSNKHNRYVVSHGGCRTIYWCSICGALGYEARKRINRDMHLSIVKNPRVRWYIPTDTICDVNKKPEDLGKITFRGDYG